MAFRWNDADSQAVLDEHGEWLALDDGETIQYSAKTVRDIVVFTERRLIVGDVRGGFVTRKEREYRSYPYRNIGHWKVLGRSGGLINGAELMVWMGSQDQPAVELELAKNESARLIAQLMARYAS